MFKIVCMFYIMLLSKRSTSFYSQVGENVVGATRIEPVRLNSETEAEPELS